MSTRIQKTAGAVFLAIVLAAAAGSPAHAVIDGITGTSPMMTFNFTAKAGYISAGDGRQVLIWGFANGTSPVQYPGPTLLLHKGDTVNITLTNSLATNVSMIFPGMDNVSCAGGTPGLLTDEVAPGGTATYTFTANNAGTYYYQSATNPDLQVEMGLFGAIVVYPCLSFPAVIGESTPGEAYCIADTHYDREYLFVLSEMDPRIHQAVEYGTAYDTSSFFATYWFINGRTAPDSMSDPYVPWLPTQPYNSLPRMHPGEKVLARLVNMGRDPHPFHTHGNNMLVIAEDGRLLSTTGANTDLAVSNFTMTMQPGRTADAIFEWTGAGLGWDIYGHAPGDAMEPDEYAADHGKAFPTPLPNVQELTVGLFYSGSPFLGALGALPPGEGGFNPMGAFTFMWHSHTEKELVNDNVFPGGMMTMMFVEHPLVTIP